MTSQRQCPRCHGRVTVVNTLDEAVPPNVDYHCAHCNAYYVFDEVIFRPIERKNAPSRLD